MLAVATIFTLCYCQCALCIYFLLTLLILFLFFLRFSICSIPFSPCLTHEAYCINHLFVFFPLYFISLVCNFCSSSSYFLCFMFLFAFKNSFLLVILVEKLKYPAKTNTQPQVTDNFLTEKRFKLCNGISGVVFF